MFDTATMILISLAFAFLAFILASNYFSRFWHWLIAAAVTFAAFAIIIANELDTALIVAVVIYVALLVITLIKNHLQ